MGRLVSLPTGKELDITVSPFSISKALYQAVCEEVKNLKLDPEAEIDANFWKDIFCSGLSSKKIDLALDECMKRCTYGGLKIDKDTFEPVESREDYLLVCFEVAKDNITPFTKSLYAQFGTVFQKLKNTLA